MVRSRPWGVQLLRGIFTVACLVAVCSLVTVTVAVPAASANEADDLLKKGTELRRQGRDMEALSEFQKALRLQDSARALAQVALAEQALGLWVDANLHLGQALQRQTDSWIKKNRATLETARDTIRGHICHVDLWGTPAGADVVIDGKRAGSLPEVDTWVAPGEISYEVKAPGFARAQRTLKTPEGMLVREHVELRPVAAEPAVASAPAPAELPPAPPPAAQPVSLIAKEPAATDTGTSDSAGGSRWWLWTLVGAVVVAGGVTAAVLLSRGSASSCDRAPCSTWN